MGCLLGFCLLTQYRSGCRWLSLDAGHLVALVEMNCRILENDGLRKSFGSSHLGALAVFWGVLKQGARHNHSFWEDSTFDFFKT